MPLDRLIRQILEEHHVAQSYINDMLEMMDESATVNYEDIENTKSIMSGQMNKLTEVSQRISLLAGRMESVTTLLTELTDVN